MSKPDRKPKASAEDEALRIANNDVFEEVGVDDPGFYHVLWINVGKNRAFVLRLGRTGYPEVKDPLELGARIAKGSLRWTSNHHFKRLPLPQPDATPEPESPAPRGDGRPQSGNSVAKANSKRSGASRRTRTISAVERALIDLRRKLLQPLMNGVADGRLFEDGFDRQVTKRAAETNTSRATLTRVLRTWFEYGMTDAALGTARKGSRTAPRKWTGSKPGRRSGDGPVGIALTAGVIRALAWGVNWLTENPLNPRADGYIALTQEFYSAGTMMVGEMEIPKPIADHLRPTERQFERYCAKELPYSKRRRHRRGERHHRLNVAPIVGTTSGFSFGPGSIGHLDSSFTAITVVDPVHRSVVLGQPTLYLTMDDFSSVIDGRHCTLSTESTEDALLAIAHSMHGFIKAPRAMPGERQQADVRKFKKKEGFTDKGGSFLSKLSDEVQKRMGAGVANPPGSSPNKRGRGERRFGMINAFTAFLPGAISKLHRGRGDVKRGNDACMTMADYTQIVDEFIRYHNSTHRPTQAPPESFLPDGRPRTAFDLLLWGIRNRGAPDRPTEDELRLCSCEHIEAAVDYDGYGLVAQGIYYDVMGEAPGLSLEKGKERTKGKQTILRDRNCIGRAWLLMSDGAQVVDLKVNARSAANAFLAGSEWEKLSKQARQGQRGGRSEVLAQRAASLAAIAPIVEGAVKARTRKKRNGLVKELREQGTRELREQIRAEVLLPDRPTTRPPKPEPATPSEPVAPKPQPPRPDAVRPRTTSGGTTDDFRAMRAKMREASTKHE